MTSSRPHEKNIELLFLTYAHLEDAASRAVVKKCMLDNLQHGETAVTHFSQLAHTMAFSPDTIIVRDLMTVLEWVNSVLVFLSTTTEVYSKQTELLLQTLGELLVKIIDVPSTEKRSRQIQSALRTTRTSFVKCLSHTNPVSIETCEFYLESLLSGSPCIRSSVTLAILATTGTDLSPSNPGIQYIIEGHINKILNMYIGTILKTKVPLPEFIVSVFDSLFTDYMTEELFNNTISPAIANAISLSPIIVLDNIVPMLFKSISPLVDPSVALHSWLLDPLLLELKKCRGETRDQCLKSLEIILSKMRPNCVKFQEVVSKVLLHLDSHSPEFLNSIGSLLYVTKSSDSGSVLIRHELEQALRSNVSIRRCESIPIAYLKHACYLLRTDSSLLLNVLEITRRGISSDFRKSWVLGFGSTLLETNPISNHLETLVLDILPDINTALVNLSSDCSVQDISAGFAFVAISSRFSNHEILNEILRPSSVLTQYRTYTALSDECDIKWAILCLESSASTLFHLNNKRCLNDWAQSWIYYVSTPSLTLQQLARAKLANLFVENQGLMGPIFISNLYSVVSGNTEYELCTRPGNVIVTMLSSCHGDSDDKTLKLNLSKLFILSHHRNVSLKGGWVGLCQRLGIDGKGVADEYGSEIFQDILSTAAEMYQYSLLREACWSAATTLFILNPIRVSHAVKYICEVLGETLREIDIPPTSVSTATKIDKDFKYAIESNNSIEISIALELITALSKSSKIESKTLESWYPTVVNALLKYLTLYVGRISLELSNAACEVFLSLANHISKALTPWKADIGAAILRSLGFAVNAKSMNVSLIELESQVLSTLDALVDPTLNEAITISYVGLFVLGIAQNEGNKNAIFARKIVARNHHHFKLLFSHETTSVY